MIFTLLGLDAPFWARLVLIALFAVSLMIAIIPHEVAHGAMALKMGDPTAKLEGRLSLNPSKHIEPLGLLSFCIVGIGWAKPVPVNPFNYTNFRRGNFWVSIAGILTNLLIAFVLSLVLFFIMEYSRFDFNLGIRLTAIDFFGYFIFMCILLNLTLALFNLLPIYPLDGYNMLVSYTKPNNRFMNFMREQSMWVILVAIAVLFFTDIFGIVTDFILDGFLWLWGLIFIWL